MWSTRTGLVRHRWLGEVAGNVTSGVAAEEAPLLSHPRSHRSTPRRLVAVVALVAAVGSGCAEDGDVDQKTFEADLRERTGIDRGVTECLTERIFDDFEADEVNEIYRADDEADLDDATRVKLSDINGACFAEAAPETTAPEGGGEDVGGSSSTTEGDATTTSAPADTSSTTAAGGG